MRASRPFLFAAGTILLCLGCASGVLAEEPSEKLTDEGGPLTAGCRFSLSADREAYDVGQPIKLQLKLKNESKSQLNGFSYPTDILETPHYRVELRCAAGIPVLLTDLGRQRAQGRFGSFAGYEIPPGESESVEEAGVTNYFHLGSPGNYRLTVYRRYGWDKKWLEIPSNTILLRITEREAPVPDTR